ncbi:TIGR01777 family oxidoreductase [bacterium]|nr:TIGR01777 family oxidoreductase [candidate division CSSED10-310 bacterium]
MPEFTHSSIVYAPVEEVFAWHARPGAFERLAPPWESIRILEKSGGIRVGGEVAMELRLGPITRRWVARHTLYEKDRRFVDEQVRGPFASWRHDHRFTPRDEGSCVLVDHLRYRFPFGPLGTILGTFTKDRLRSLFIFRHRRIKEDLQRHGRYEKRPRLSLAITGASGLVGTALAAFLTTGGHRVHKLVRRPVKNENEIFWDPERGEIDYAALENLDGVIHLAGENIAGGRWTETRKRAIRDSRERGTALLAETLAGLRRPPPVLVSSSAIGYYGTPGDKRLTEADPPGSGFLPEVCVAWENAAGRAAAAGIRVVMLRTGIVLSGAGGALPRLLTPFRLGLGGSIGNGRQYMSWIALDDLLAVYLQALYDDDMRGPYNAVAPAPVTNAVFAAVLGRVLQRPAVIPVPPAALRATYGEMAEELLIKGQRVIPERLRERSFTFFYPDLEDALRMAVGRFT